MDGEYYQEAIGFYLAIMERFPEDTRAYQELPAVYQRAGQLSEAAAAIELAIEKAGHPEPGFYIQAGSIYEELGRFADAESMYMKALDLDPENNQAKRRLESIQNSENIE